MTHELRQYATYEFIEMGGSANVEDMITQICRRLGPEPGWIVVIDTDEPRQSIQITVWSQFTPEYPIPKMLRKAIHTLYTKARGREVKQ